MILIVNTNVSQLVIQRFCNPRPISAPFSLNHINSGTRIAKQPSAAVGVQLQIDRAPSIRWSANHWSLGTVSRQVCTSLAGLPYGPLDRPLHNRRIQIVHALLLHGVIRPQVRLGKMHCHTHSRTAFRYRCCCARAPASRILPQPASRSACSPRLPRRGCSPTLASASGCCWQESPHSSTVPSRTSRPARISLRREP